MAKVTVKFSCGCGFKTENYVEAIIHSDEENHSMDILGKIQKEVKKDGTDKVAVLWDKGLAEGRG